MYFETHAHYDDEQYDIDRNELLASLPAFGVTRIINIGADMESSHASVALAEKYGYIYATVGVHPHYVDKMTEKDMDILAELTKNDKVVGIGETGLDYFRNISPRETQVYWFKRQLELVKTRNIPVIIHSREATQETFDIIKESSVRRGIIHCYAGSAEMAKEYVKMGFLIGVGGVVTYPKARNIIETVEQIPLEHIVIETDCPYLPPTPHRGTRNVSQNLKYIVQKISEIKQISHEEVAEKTFQNACALFVVN